MTISKKLYLNFGAILALLLVMFIVNLTAVQREHAARASASRALQLAQESEAVRFQMMQNHLYLRNYLLSGDSREVDTMNDGIARLNAMLKDLTAEGEFRRPSRRPGALQRRRAAMGIQLRAAAGG